MKRLLVVVATLLTPLGSALAQVSTQELVVTLGPVRLPANAEHRDIVQTGMQTVRVPFDGWLQEYDVELRDAAGNRLPHELLHHAELIDLGRRDLLRPLVQRIASMGRETPSLVLPTSLGYPVRGGVEIGVNPMLVNPTSVSYGSVYVRVTLRVLPGTVPAAPRPVLTFHTDVPGTSPYSSAFDLPAGRTVKQHEFTLPIAGTVFAVGGHLHEYGRRMVVENLTTGDTLYDASPRMDSLGRITGMPIAVLLAGGGLHVQAGTHYRLTAVYDNPTDRILPDGGMATFGAIFLPDDPSQWPALDRDDPAVRADLAILRTGHPDGSATDHHHGH